ncbi:MAG: site-2 protease family protein [Thermoleophilaceae bacterium]|nr:site-2 protease family protein [Thermoleophilaceae bacterium]
MSWLLAFIAFAVLVVLHEYGHFLAARSVGMQATRFSLFFPPALFKYKPKKSETTYEIGAIPLGGFVKITGMNPEEEIPEEHLARAYYKQPVWKRVVVIAAGPAMNLAIAFLLVFVLLAFVGETTGFSSNIATVNPGSPAAGKIQEGDKLVAINGREGSAQQLVKELNESSCAGKQTDGCAATEPVQVTVERGGETQTFSAVPRYDAEVERMRLGLSFASVTETQSIPSAFTDTASRLWQVTWLTMTLPKRLFVEEERKQISSVAGGYKQTQQAVDTSTEMTIKIIALISLSLAIINLFPFLPLDGGHIFWALAEKVRGKPIPVPVLERASIIGLALIGMLFVIGLSNDIDRFRNGGFGP